MVEIILNATVPFHALQVSVELNISRYCYSADWRIHNSNWMMSIYRKIDVTVILFLLVQNKQQTHDWTLMDSAYRSDYNLSLS